MRISDGQFLEVIKNTPLVSIDLIVKDQEERILMGFRKNEPVKDTWFVPGGRIQKGETLDRSFERITSDELGITYTRDKARLIGVFDAIYDTNFLGIEGVGTHYVAIGYEIKPTPVPRAFPTGQHRSYQWFSPMDLENNDIRKMIHPNNYPYFEII
jgi:colanic acid biosynthesis protein WcaH